jgi:flagellar hook capping protein FlgD
LRTALVLILLAGTAAAFVVTEDLKLEPDPIAQPRIDRVFSPVCRCEQQTARVSFKLRRADHLTLSITDDQDRVVRTILRGARFAPGRHQFGWDGRDDDGKLVPEGTYRARVELAALGRAIVFPRRIVVDTTAPEIAITRLSRRVISPDGDGRSDATMIRFRADEPVQAVLLVNGRQEAKTRVRPSGAIPWSPRGRRRGVYDLRLTAVDAAGNKGRPTRTSTVRIRYVAVTPETIRVRPGRRFSIRISTDAKRYSWRFARRRGSARVRTLALRAPKQPGRYAFVAVVSGRRDSSLVVVHAR